MGWIFWMVAKILGSSMELDQVKNQTQVQTQVPRISEGWVDVLILSRSEFIYPSLISAGLIFSEQEGDSFPDSLSHKNAIREMM